MNVNCETTEQFVRNKNERFENLRLGPQLLKDIKKMLTHPMQNPYSKVAMKSNYIVMQDYKPPAGQLFPNGALLAGPERAPNMVYVPKQNLIQNYINRNTTFSDTTPDPKYTTIRPTTYRNTEIFQKQQLNGQYTQSKGLQSNTLLPGKTISNGHTRQFSQFQKTNFINNSKKTQIYRQNNKQRNIQKPQRLTNFNNSGVQTNNMQHYYKAQLNKLNSQYTLPKKSTPTKNTFKQTEQYYATDQDKQTNANRTSFTQSPYELPEEIQNEVKQNVVSKFSGISTTTKTIAYSRIIENPQPGKPKSRVTVKTWIIKPTKSAKLIASPSSYTLDTIQQPLKDKVLKKTFPYVYETPTTQSQLDRIISKPSPTPYTYNRPTVSAQQIITTTNDYTELNVPSTPTPTPISTPKPKLQSRSMLAERLDVLPKVTSSTQRSQLYLHTTTSKPSSRLYLPPQNAFLSRQYLSSIVQPPVYYSSNQLSDISSSPAPVYISDENRNFAEMSLTTEMPFDSTSNLIFTDILTKHKNDNSVNTIVKDTNDILKTSSLLEFDQYDQNLNSVINSDSVTDSGESLTSQIPTTDMTSVRKITLPSTKLEPPDERSIYQNMNILSELPYFKESLLPPANTIERTVSLRITIPEKLAAYLFKNANKPDYDKLEILNTDNSNYLVLRNNMVTAKPNFNPLDKSLGFKNNNISNSQALVFSLLADSINAAKEYTNIAQHDVLSSTSAPTQFQNINNEELSQITSKISQLTTSQFSGNNNNRNENIVATIQTPSITQGNQLHSNVQYMRNLQLTSQQVSLQQPQQLQNNFAPPQTQENYYTMQLQNNGVNSNPFTNNANQIYSGQLYQYSVPDVTKKIYNRPLSSDISQTSNNAQNNIPTNLIQSSPNYPTNFIQSTNIPNRNSQSLILPFRNQNNAANLMNKHPSFEIVKSQTLPFTPAKVQLESSNEPNSLNQETATNLLNSDNEISAQLLDKIVGTIPHPLENNKLVTYENNQSYFFTTELDNTGSTANRFTHSNVIGGQNNIPTQNNFPNELTFQFIPSVRYELNNEKDQHQILNAFRIDEFGAPRDIVKSNYNDNNQAEPIMTTNIDYSIDHSKSAKQTDGSTSSNSLYSGPSSYFPPQASIGSLGAGQETVQNNFNSRLEDLNDNNGNGYPKTRPTRQFVF